MSTGHALPRSDEAISRESSAAEDPDTNTSVRLVSSSRRTNRSAAAPSPRPPMSGRWVMLIV